MSQGSEESEVAAKEPAIPFPVVGIGASAGGLEALQDLFSDLAVGCGMAFVVVQHLSPDFKSMMVDILGRHTDLDVQVAISIEVGVPQFDPVVPLEVGDGPAGHATERGFDRHTCEFVGQEPPGSPADPPMHGFDGRRG